MEISQNNHFECVRALSVDVFNNTVKRPSNLRTSMYITENIYEQKQ